MISLQLSPQEFKNLVAEYKRRAKNDEQAANLIFSSSDAIQLTHQSGLLYLQALEKEMTSEAILFSSEFGVSEELGEVLRWHSIDELARCILTSCDIFIEKRGRDLSPSDITTLKRIFETFQNFINTDERSNHIHNNLRYPRLHKTNTPTGEMITHWSSEIYSMADVQGLKIRLEHFKDWATNVNKLIRSMVRQ